MKILLIYLIIYLGYLSLYLNIRFRNLDLSKKSKQQFISLTEKYMNIENWGGISENDIIKSQTYRTFHSNRVIKGVWYYFKDYSYSFNKPFYFKYGNDSVHAPYKTNLVYFSGDIDHTLRNETDEDKEVIIGYIYE
mgnify:CR=1 FL=1